MKCTSFFLFFFLFYFQAISATLTIGSIEGNPGGIVSLPVYIDDIDFQLAGGEIVISLSDTLEFRAINFADNYSNSYEIETDSQEGKIAVAFASAIGISIIGRSELFKIELRIIDEAIPETLTKVKWQYAKLYNMDRQDFSPLTVGGLVTITTETDLRVWPMVITPNDPPDGYNDYVNFAFPTFGEGEKKIEIFDLHGRKVWEKTSQSLRIIIWDGRDHIGQVLIPGCYLYIMRLNGTIVSKGTVTIML